MSASYELVSKYDAAAADDTLSFFCKLFQYDYDINLAIRYEAHWAMEGGVATTSWPIPVCVCVDEKITFHNHDRCNEIWYLL